MLRILRDDLEGHRVVLILLGRIVDEWAEVLESECLDLSRTGRHVTLNLAGVVFVGQIGLEALVRLSRSGVEIKGCSPLIADMLEQEGIKAGRNFADLNDRTLPWKRGGETDA